MAGNRNDIEMRITADSRGVAAGLAPMMKGLEGAQKAAGETEKALDAIGTTPVKVSVNDQAIENARVEVARLRNEMRQRLSLDPTANTKDAEKRIKELQRSIKVLDEEEAVVDVAVRTTGLQTLSAVVSDVRNGFAGGGGLIQGLGAARAGLAGVGTEAAAGALAVGAVGVAFGVAAKQAWDLGEAAADVQTSVAQLDSLTFGHGAETFRQLNEFAAKTPFELDEVTAATKRLVAAGVPLSDVQDNLGDIGNVAAATGVPLEQLATVFAQMESSGRASYEDLKQLAEAGIPVWQTLSDKLGIATADLQKMASEGKLGADTIDLLRESLAELYPTGMQTQADTFNGQISTLKDTLHQTSATLGTLFLPLMQDLVNFVQIGADAWSGFIGKIAEFDGWLRKINDDAGLVETSLGAIPGIGPLIRGLNDANDDGADAAKKHSTEADRLAASITAEAEAATAADQAITDHQTHLDSLADAVDRTADRYADLVDSFTAFNDGLIENRSAVYNYQGAVDDLAESLVKSGSFSPDLEAGRTNWDNLVGLAESASARVQDTFETKGIDAATALQRSFRKSMAQMLIDAGRTAPEAWKLVNQVLEEPHQVKLELGEIDTSKLEKQLASLKQQRADIKAGFVIPEGATEKEAQRILDERGAALKPITAKIEAHTTKIDESKEDLDGVAEKRTATIVPKVPAKDVEEANSTLDGIIKLRRARIKIEIIPPEVPFFGGLPISGPTPSSTAGPAALASASTTMLASPAPTATSSGGGSGTTTIRVGGTGGSSVQRIAPKATPVAVYLDGVEIAHRIEARRALAATTSVRRSA